MQSMLDFLRRQLNAIFGLLSSEEDDSEITTEPREKEESPVDVYIAQKETEES